MLTMSDPLLTGAPLGLGAPLSLKEVARLLHVSTRTVERYIQQRRFPPGAYLPGGSRCWFADDIKAYLHYVMRGTFSPVRKEEPS